MIINNFDNIIYNCRPFKKFIKEKIQSGEKFFEQSKDDCMKMMIFSGRDTSLVDIISNLLDEEYVNGLIDNNNSDVNDHAINFLIPKFASSFIFELHFDEKQYKYYVKILYNGEENIQRFRKVFGVNVVYHKEKGILYEDFKALLNSRINSEYQQMSCSDE